MIFRNVPVFQCFRYHCSYCSTCQRKADSGDENEVQREICLKADLFQGVGFG